MKTSMAITAVAFIGLTAWFYLPTYRTDMPLGGVSVEQQLLADIARERKTQRVHRKEARDGYQVEVHEYVTPDGTEGYQVILEKNGVTKSQGYGPEAASRTYEVIEAYATSTPNN